MYVCMYVCQYEAEGINWMHVGFSDNAEVVDLLEGRKVGSYYIIFVRC